MSYKSVIGKIGEDIACRYLVDNGFQIIQRNFRQKWGEIDIIAKSSDKTLVFVEVKTLFNGSHPVQEAIALSTDEAIRQISGLPYRIGIGETNTAIDWKPGSEIWTREKYPEGISSNSTSWKPENQMTFQKIKRLKRTASLYAGKNQNLIDDQRGWRIDLLASAIFDQEILVNYYENIF